MVSGLLFIPTLQDFCPRAGADFRMVLQKYFADQNLGKCNKGSKMTTSRSKAEEHYAEIQKRERGIRQELDNATKLRLEKAAKLRQLRLAKEAEDAAEKQAAEDIKAAGKSAFKKASPST